MKKFASLVWALCACAHAQPVDPMPTVAEGRVERLAHFGSSFVAPRNVDVWLPPAYDPRNRYAVLYMHDGQELFDPVTAWNHRTWGMARTMAALIREGKIPPTLVVGIWNTGATRHSEYFPQKALAFMAEPMRTRFLSKELGGQSRSDAYLRFIVEELKPEIDRRYSTNPDREHTAIMGSSMGGIISLYAICEYPGTFGAAGCLSTHWPGIFSRNAAIPLATFDYLSKHVPPPATHRLYFDRGTVTLDALYPESQAFADLIFQEAGYSGRNFQSRVFAGDAHVEEDWGRRVAQPIAFLLGP